MKVKLFTHTDLDGVGCAIVALNQFGYDNADIVYCDYHNVDDRVMEFLNSGDELLDYDKVFITDISVKEHVATEIDSLVQNGVVDFFLLDHHESADWLNKYDWARVIQVDENDNVNTSGTSLFAGYLEENGYDVSSLIEFVELVRRYDTWDWYNIHGDLEAKRLNDLFWLIGRDRFIKKFHGQLQTIGYFLTEQDLLFLEIEQEKIDRYVEKSLKQLTAHHVGRYNVGVVFGEQYVNEVCQAAYEANPELDLIAMINLSSRKLSYRTGRKDIDVGKFAKYFGGGGRAATAGSEISETHIDTILNVIFQS